MILQNNKKTILVTFSCLLFVILQASQAEADVLDVPYGDQVESVHENIYVNLSGPTKVDLKIYYLRGSSKDDRLVISPWQTSYQIIKDVNCSQIVHEKGWNKTVGWRPLPNDVIWLVNVTGREDATFQIDCTYYIENYLQELTVDEYILSDYFVRLGSENESKVYYLTINTPNKSIVVSSIPTPSEIGLCTNSLNSCQQKLVFRTEQLSNRIIYMRIQKIELEPLEILSKYAWDFVLAGLIGGLIALIIEKPIEIIIRKRLRL